MNIDFIQIENSFRKIIAPEMGRCLKWKSVRVLGSMMDIWEWCLAMEDGRPTGIIRGSDAAERIELVAGWKKKRGFFIEIGTKFGVFRSENDQILIRGVEKRYGKLWDQRQSNAERQRRFKQGKRAESNALPNASEQGECAESNALPNASGNAAKGREGKESEVKDPSKRRRREEITSRVRDPQEAPPPPDGLDLQVEQLRIAYNELRPPNWPLWTSGSLDPELTRDAVRSRPINEPGGWKDVLAAARHSPWLSGSTPHPRDGLPYRTNKVPLLFFTQAELILNKKLDKPPQLRDVTRGYAYADENADYGPPGVRDVFA